MKDSNQISETRVYVLVKQYLIRTYWSVLAGQPPSGTDHLPVVEIKDSSLSGNGSKGSFKPDLIAWKEEKLLFVELKPIFSIGDQIKVEGVLNSPERIDSLWEELIQRNLLVSGGARIDSIRERTQVVGGLGYAGQAVEHPHLWRFLVEGNSVHETPATFQY